MKTVNVLACYYTFLHREILGHPFKSSVPLFSFYKEAGNVLIPTSSDSVQQT